MSGYEEMLSRCMEKIPKECREGSRFCMPKAEVLIQGARTLFVNFNEVAGALRRDPRHMLKFFLKELATSCEEMERKIVFQGRFPGPLMDRKVELYVKNYVMCPNCCRPDTKLMKVDRIEVLKCEACGSKTPVKNIR